jgi:hypothetical protein
MTAVPRWPGLVPLGIERNNPCGDVVVRITAVGRLGSTAASAFGMRAARNSVLSESRQIPAGNRIERTDSDRRLPRHRSKTECEIDSR